MKVNNKQIAFMMGWIFGTLSMLFMPILMLLGYEYDVTVERKVK